MSSAAEGFVLESEWTPPEGDGRGHYRLTLSNRGSTPLRDFRLGVTGPSRIDEEDEISGATIAERLSTYCVFAPAEDLVLAPGASWVIDIKKTVPLRHWTDGATSAFVIHADNSTTSAMVPPTRHMTDDQAPLRGTMRLPVSEDAPSISVIPWPRSVEVSGRRSVPTGFAILAEDGAGEVVADNFAALTQFLFPGEGIVRDDEEGGYPVDCRFDETLGEEGYVIEFAGDGAEVIGGTETGLLYGFITLAQIQRGARLHPTRFAFPTSGRIEDRPAMRWRGCHLDVARRFYSSEEIKQFLSILCWNKLNVLHWHLSDDEAWRVEIDAYPALTETAAWRGYGQAIPPLLGAGPEPSGGYYTQDAVRDIVDLAEDFGIDVVPEIDMPGHCYALLQVLPELRDKNEPGTGKSIQAFPNNSLNPGVGAVYTAVETILGELVELFPSQYFHVGADEVPANAWETSPLAQGLLQKLDGDGTAALQAHFLQRVQTFLSRKGKITGAWEEAAHGGGIERERCYLVGWQNAEAGRKLAAEGYDVVVAPGQAYYLDMANSANWHEPGASWAGHSSPESTYAFDPADGWSAAEKAKLLGVQACIWSEPMTDRAVFDRLVFPRLSAIAETGWTPRESRDYARFATMAGLMPSLYRTSEPADK